MEPLAEEPEPEVGPEAAPELEPALALVATGSAGVVVGVVGTGADWVTVVVATG